jgi:glutamate synthase (NADPH) small chain
LRYGIPDFKLEKHHIDRRMRQLMAEGVAFQTGVTVGITTPAEDILRGFDAVLVAVGAETPRDPKLPGQNLAGVHFAMPFLTEQNRRVGGEDITAITPISAAGKHVVVIGGGDTASDCIGTSFRQGALSVTQLDIRPEPPERADPLSVWPYWQTKMRVSSSQAEGANRSFAVATLALEGVKGHVQHVRCAQVNEKRVPIEGTTFYLRADLVLIALGFSAVDGRLPNALGLTLTPRATVAAPETDYRTPLPHVFAAGDARRGQSLVVWAIREGRQAAHAIDAFLMGSSALPRF